MCLIHCNFNHNLTIAISSPGFGEMILVELEFSRMTGEKLIYLYHKLHGWMSLWLVWVICDTAPMDHWWHLWVICDFTCHFWLHNKSWVISLIFLNILICWTDNSGYKFQPMPSFIFPDQSLAKWFTQESFQSNWGKANCGWDRQIEQVQESNKRIQFCERRSWGIENDPKRITRSPRSNV